MRLFSKIKGVIARGILELINDEGLQISLLNGEKMTNTEYLQNFGYASEPPKGSYIIGAFLGGNRNNPTVLIVEHPDRRPSDIADGESVMYNEKLMRIYMRKDGTIHMTGTDLVKFLLDKDFQHDGSKFGMFAKAAVTQPGHVPDPVGGVTIDSQARAAIVLINTAMAAIGSTAAS